MSFTLTALPAYLPLPASTADWSALLFFGGLLAFIAWRVYDTRPLP